MTALVVVFAWHGSRGQLALNSREPISAAGYPGNNAPRTHKINLSIGIYFDNEGRIPVLDRWQPAAPCPDQCETALRRPKQPDAQPDAPPNMIGRDP
ncbi:hypothetical protein ACVBEH_18715, partial [Roseateles sp. GG27B]